MASGPVREPPPTPEKPKLLVPMVRFFAKVRKVSCTKTEPAFTRSAMGRASSSLPAITEAVSPKVVSLARWMASSMLRNFITGRQGPKVSSCMMSMSCVTFVSTVGRM